MSNIVWEEPPGVSRRGQEEWPAIARELRQRPGQWARVKDGVSASNAAHVASRIRNGFFQPFRPAGTFEAVTRRTGDTKAVYARYVGEQDGGAS
jgi:hypothetical protein